MLNLSHVRQYIVYEPGSGEFRWARTPRYTSAKNPGDRAGHVAKNGYRFIKFGTGSYRAANLAWFFVHGEMPPDGLAVDHIDGVRDNDRISNLRLATPKQNQANRRPHVGSSSRFKGVTLHRQCGRWQAALKTDGKMRYLGLYDSEEQAAQAYDVEALKLFGEFARLNLQVAA